jgi:hypothetical protein
MVGYGLVGVKKKTRKLNFVKIQLSKMLGHPLTQFYPTSQTH